MKLPHKVATALTTLTAYDLAPATIAPRSYRWYLRWRPDTPPPLWGGSPGYWTALALGVALIAGSLATAFSILLMTSAEGTAVAGMSHTIFLIVQFGGWAAAGLIGAAVASESKRGAEREREAIGLPEWDQFSADWRPSLAVLRDRARPERFWLRSLHDKPLVRWAGVVGLLAFILLAWFMPVKAGSAGTGFILAYMVISSLGLSRSVRNVPMPRQPRLWQCANGFWIGWGIGAVSWNTIPADLLGYPSDRMALLFAITVLAMHLADWFMFEQQKNIALKVERAEQSRQLADARLAALKAQVEPHFIFNTIAHLKQLILTEPPRAARMADELADFLRASLKSLRSEQTTVEADFALLSAYLGIARQRMGDRLTVDIQADPGTLGLALPPLMLLTLVENAVLHGVEPKPGSVEIRVQAKIDSPEAALVLTVSDNGMGFGAGTTGGTGVGLANLRERLASAYGDAASLALRHREGGGVEAELRLPMRIFAKEVV
ncbi:MAG: histidine kinase [Burkholderiales bacterium]|nr:histidine kinase [Burkholderiales bacterium]